MKLIAIALLLSVAACGGSEEDDGATWDGISATNEERAALDSQCVGHGGIGSFRQVIALEADGQHRYFRGFCADGTAIQIERA